MRPPCCCTQGVLAETKRQKFENYAKRFLNIIVVYFDYMLSMHNIL